MKFFNNKLIVLFFLVVLTFSISSVETEESCQGISFEGLPLEIQQKIVSLLVGTEDFGQSLKCLKNISQVNRQLNELIGDSRALSAIITSLQEKDEKLATLPFDALMLLFSSELAGARSYFLNKFAADKKKYGEEIAEIFLLENIEPVLFQTFESGVLKDLKLDENQIINLMQFVLLSLGFDINTGTVQFNGNRLLHYAAEYNLPKVAEFILKQPGINVELRNNDFKTALDIAEEKGNQEIVKAIYKAKPSKVIVIEE
ncbi:MAG: ankyrin repeat domain-containing protein [Candidatus Babeliales bacterium]